MALSVRKKCSPNYLLQKTAILSYVHIFSVTLKKSVPFKLCFTLLLFALSLKNCIILLQFFLFKILPIPHTTLLNSEYNLKEFTTLLHNLNPKKVFS